jgi:hypothetical protein
VVATPLDSSWHARQLLSERAWVVTASPPWQFADVQGCWLTVCGVDPEGCRLEIVFEWWHCRQLSEALRP